MPLLTTANGGYIYRGFRVLPCFTSGTTGRPVKSQNGWESGDLDPGYNSFHGRRQWFPALDRFQREIDELYDRAAIGRLPSERVRDLRAAIGRLDDPNVAQASLTVLEHGLSLAAERARAEAEARAARDAEHLARQRLHAAAPDLLAALRQIEAATVDGGTINTIARAAIARATQEA